MSGDSLQCILFQLRYHHLVDRGRWRWDVGAKGKASDGFEKGWPP